MLRASQVLRAEAAQSEVKTTAGKVLFKFRSPTMSMVDGEIDLAIVPGLAGDFGVSDKLSPLLAQLRPGVVSVQKEANSPMQKWFVTGGFAVMQEDNVCAVTVSEAIPVEHLDINLINQQLVQNEALVASAGTPEGKAEAEIAVEVYSAMKTAF
jgi:F-type H+-transporting ATPase subunit delta